MDIFQTIGHNPNIIQISITLDIFLFIFGNIPNFVYLNIIFFDLQAIKRMINGTGYKH